VIRGYAALYDVETDLGEFREVIRPGAFKAAVARDDVRALFNHDPNYVLGRTTARTLFLDEDEAGLPVVIMPPDAQWARDMMSSMQRGDINQMSFAFSVDGQTWNTESRDKPLRELRDVTLYDVSVVTYPAYPETSAAVRAEARALSDDTLTDGAGQADGESDDKRAGGRQALNAAKIEIAKRK
jgi:HK97 family phage prohead protease